MAGRRRDE